MNTKILVSVITPVYNIVKSGRGAFLRQCIESVHNQSYPNIEHIVQDGFSKDGTLEILKEYEKKKWITIFSEKDANVHEALNRAISRAKGDYIAILCSDDYYKDNEIIKDIVEKISLNRDIDYICGNEEHISVSDDSFIQVWKCLNNEFWRGVCASTEATFFSKKIFNEAGMFDLNYPHTADLKLQMFWKLNDYKWEYVDKTILVARRGDGISSNPKTLFWHKKEYAEICCWFWKQFEPDMTPVKAEYMLANNTYPEIFFRKLRHFVIDKKLKNFDYISFSKYIDNLIKDSADAKLHRILKIGLYPFKNISILKFVKQQNYTTVFFMGIPIIKIRYQN